MTCTEESISFWNNDFYHRLSLTNIGIPINQILLDYFSLSGFYDKTCDNEACEMQGRSRISDDLVKMTGIQYSIDKVERINNSIIAIFVKIKRDSPEKKDILAYYYMLDGVIYRSPYFMSVLKTRLTNSLYYMNEALNIVLDDEEKLREEHLENADNLIKNTNAIPNYLSMRELYEKYPLDNNESNILSKRKFIPQTPEEQDKKRQKI